jgi:hypothetical protein
MEEKYCVWVRFPVGKPEKSGTRFSRKKTLEWRLQQLQLLLFQAWLLSREKESHTTTALHGILPPNTKMRPTDVRSARMYRRVQDSQ